MMRSCIAGSFFLASTQLAHADWQFDYLKAESADELNVCVAGEYFSDGPFLVRIHENVMDFYLADDSFALPPSQMLGRAAFIFKSNTFILAAEAGSSAEGRNTANHMFLHPSEDDYEEILQSLRYSSEMTIIFPDNSSFSIPLKGSNVALEKAFDCWSSRVTGTGGVNPFGETPSQSDPSNNPFE